MKRGCRCTPPPLHSSVAGGAPVAPYISGVMPISWVTFRRPICAAQRTKLLDGLELPSATSTVLSGSSRDGGQRAVGKAPARWDLLCQFGLTNQCCQSILTNMDIEELSVNLSSDDPAIGLRASLALHRLAERVEANQVEAAREKGWSWQQIGDALGVTRQSVHTKYNKESS